MNSISNDVVRRYLQLTRSASSPILYTYISAYRIRIDVTATEEMEPQIFLWRRGPVSPYTGQATDTFFTICSPVDMSEWPAEAPDPNAPFPFFRRSWMEVDFRSIALADEGWQMIKKEAAILVHGLNKLEELQVVEVVDIGPYPDDFDDDVSLGSLSAVDIE